MSRIAVFLFNFVPCQALGHANGHGHAHPHGVLPVIIIVVAVAWLAFSAYAGARRRK